MPTFITPYVRVTGLSPLSREVIEAEEYLFYSCINYSQTAGEYYSSGNFYHDVETGRIDLPPEKKLEIKKKISLECLDIMKKMYDELRTVAPAGRLQALRFAKQNRFSQNNECFLAYRESDNYVFETKVYFTDDSVARIYCYKKEGTLSAEKEMQRLRAFIKSPALHNTYYFEARKFSIDDPTYYLFLRTVENGTHVQISHKVMRIKEKFDLKRLREQIGQIFDEAATYERGFKQVPLFELVHPVNRYCVDTPSLTNIIQSQSL